MSKLFLGKQNQEMKEMKDDRNDREKNAKLKSPTNQPPKTHPQPLPILGRGVLFKISDDRKQMTDFSENNRKEILKSFLFFSKN